MSSKPMRIEEAQATARLGSINLSPLVLPERYLPNSLRVPYLKEIRIE